MARVVRTPAARHDLKTIGRYIAGESQSLAIAKRFIDAIDAKCTLYSKTPELGELCPDLGADVRRFSVGDYLVFYRVVAGRFQVLRVLHGYRDITTAWRSQ